ncbi:hypothetical protein GGR57DRAFT_498456 [Xylariaceae sp. FL1272]|nr:hypothetical protein GGR57DRAFT_498456 [Xylariaceae sp. FL1272]
MAISPTELEGIVEYIVGSLIFIARWMIRWRLVGIKSWEWDDWLSVVAWIVSTIYFILVEELGQYGAPVGFTQEMREALTPELVASFEYGSKILVACFGFLIALQWTLKATLITFFMRLTRQTKLYNYTLVVAGISVVAFVAAVVTWPVHCLPIRRAWQILPDPGFECSLNISTNIVMCVGSAFVDLLLLAIPVMLVKDIRITFIQKALIVFVLSTGVFAMGITIARGILSVQPGSERVAQNSAWGNREILVTIFAVNVPIVHVLFKRETWKKMWGIESRTYVKTDDREGDTNMSSRGMKGSKSSKMEIYKMTSIHMNSHESETKLFHGHGVPGAFIASNAAQHGSNV